MLRPIRTSPTLRLFDVLAAYYLTRRGNAVLAIEQATLARTLSEQVCRYIEVSGHLNTVKGRKPHVVKKISRALDAIRSLLRPGLTHYGPDGKPVTRVLT